MNYSTIEQIKNTYQKQFEFKNELKTFAIAERINWLKSLKKSIIDRQDDIKVAIHKDFGKSPTETEITEILPSILELNHFIKNIKKWAKNRSVSPSLLFAATTAKLVYEPKGNTLIITPWNYPFLLPIMHLSASVSAGNTVILKLSEATPNTNKILQEIISKTFEEKHVAIILGEVEETTYLTSLKFDHIHFTGSSTVGKIIMRRAAAHLTDITLELGGKSPVFIDKEINIKEVAKNIIWSKFVNMGQTCIAPDYLLVDKSIEHEFDAAIREEMYNAFGSDPAQSLDLARIINHKQFDRLVSYLDELEDSSTTWITKGENDKNTLFIHPTIIKNVPQDANIMKDEIFGPILPIYYYSELHDALNIVDQKEKPLALYIFSKNQSYIDKVINTTTAGGTTVNDALIHIMHPNLPFGGVNNSGIGQSKGFYGFKSFSHERSVLKPILFPMSKFFWYPYGANAHKVLHIIRKIFFK